MTVLDILREPMSDDEVSPVPVSDLATRLRALRDSLLEGLVERDVAIRLALLAALAGEHLLLVGPPGTAKSLLARRLHLAFEDATYFERLLTRFTVPEELFGPLSIKSLEQDRYERLTESYLPSASVAFLDEVFKANSAILNALLTLLNEREFDNGARRVRTPLLAVVGASNELPESEELDALFDRFLLRLHVGPVSTAGFRSLLALRGDGAPAIPPALRLTLADLAEIQERARAAEVPDDVLALLCELRDFCAGANIAVSDRRWRKALRLLQVSAVSNGRSRVSIWDAWLLQHCLWEDPEERAAIYDWYATRVGASASMDPSRLTKIVVAWEGQLRRDKDSRSQMRDAEGGLLYRDEAGALTSEPRGLVQLHRDDEPLYLAPAGAMRRGNYFEHVQDRANGGKGFTAEELDGLYIDVRGSHRPIGQWKERDSYVANRANWLMEEAPMSPAMEPTRHKQAYLKDVLAGIDQVRRDIEVYKTSLAGHLRSMNDEIREHLWVTADFIEPAAARLRETTETVELLLARVDTVRKGFEGLPCDDAIPPLTPAAKDGRGARRSVGRT